MDSIIKFVVCLLLLLSVVASSEVTRLKKDEFWVCVRWQWTATPSEGKVSCVEWAKKDCANRLYPEVCKKGG